VVLSCARALERVPPGVEQLIFHDGFTTKPRSSGRGGLGLALVQRLVIRLHGSVVVSQGPGAKFSVRLPRSAGAMLADASRSK
jgi:signal transduction histidine kinase